MKNNYPQPEKLLVYFEVSSNHYPWNSYSQYSQYHPFSSPGTILEKYLNSVSQQDYCLQKFYQTYQEYQGDQSHLFLLPDTSYPMTDNNISNENGAESDNFLIPFAYLPPKSRATEFKIGQKLHLAYSQSDFLPTIFGLLNQKAYPNSFAFDLYQTDLNADYETCHLLVQPYDGVKLAIINDLDKYTYSAEKKTITYTNLADDLLEKNPQIIAENVSYEEFKNDYYCSRYK